MKIRKTLLLAVPAAALVFGAVELWALSGLNHPAIGVQAAEYTRTQRSLSESEGAITATFDVSENDLEMKGWLLCLLKDKPTFDPTSRKLNNSSQLHPHSLSSCSHYFFAQGTKKTGTMNVTWAADSVDQKETWTEGETAGEEGKTLKDYLEADDWYLVIGPRHTAIWAEEDIPDKIGAGQDNYWENADYYVGLESNVLGNLPSGETYLDLSEFADWENDGTKFGFYYWDDDSHNGFSEFAVPVNGLEHIYLASYELGFTPTHMKAVRFTADATVPDWEKKANETQNLDAFYPYGVIGVTKWDNGWLNKLAEVDVTGKDPIPLDHYKRNGSHHSEHYSESVTLAKDAEFDISFNGSHYANITFHDSLEGVFTVKNDKITVGKADTYAFYFDTDSSSHSLYITTPVLAAADEWAQSFLKGGCETALSNWDDLAESYDALPEGSKDLFVAIEHEPNPAAVLEGYVAQAVQRYDFAISVHGTDTYYDFMGRIDAGKLSAKSVFALNASESAIALTAIGGVALVSFAGLFFLFRKRNIRAN